MRAKPGPLVPDADERDEYAQPQGGVAVEQVDLLDRTLRDEVERIAARAAEADDAEPEPAGWGAADPPSFLPRCYDVDCPVCGAGKDQFEKV